ncbi:MAG: hypothetical protein HYV63_13845 [Candidatus Schekmanbacteria bacterium]|nr:hypothetical protein [Candidatus Schekmanbacteria bacterium]
MTIAALATAVPRALVFAARRGKYVNIAELSAAERQPLSAGEREHFETFDAIYRSLCALLYNYAPLSGHPGGSISSGRFVASLLFDVLDYDVSDPDRDDADIVSYAAGHKALGLYALWAMRNEIIRLGAPELLPKDPRYQLRLEDLLGFRQNPTKRTPLFLQYGVKPLDGHPTPATPFLRLSTGASGVGVASSLGLAFGATDYFGAEDAPRVHIVEGEGGMTPGRVAEALAAAGTASLGNAILHVDWNQASIDSNRVCRENATPGDYVQWNPMELAYLHDWNVLFVPDGRDLQAIVTAQRLALALGNGQPTAIVYRTTKGWRYGIEGRASHGAGHKLCAQPFFDAIAPLLDRTNAMLPRCEAEAQRCQGGKIVELTEECFWEALGVVRRNLELETAMVAALADRLREAKQRLDCRARRARAGAPKIEAVYEAAQQLGAQPPAELRLSPGATVTLRGELGRALSYYNRRSDGAILVAAADLLGSTNISTAADGFPEGFFNATANPGSRVLSLGGICEDAMAGIFSGLSSFGRHIGAGSSYGAFIAPLGHIAARLHAIGNQARRALAAGEPFRPFILICAHAGLKTGEDGPTHADPQALQLLQENFPPGTAMTLTPWDPQEVWPLLTAALQRRPALIAPFVTRPTERVPDRQKLGLAPASAAVSGVYHLRVAEKPAGTVVLQESGVAYAFVEQALPLLVQHGIDVDVYYVASLELFDALPRAEQDLIFPERAAQEAIGITGFTLPTLYRWVRSDRGRAASLHPFRHGHFLGSGQAQRVMLEAGLDGESQFRAIRDYVE